MENTDSEDQGLTIQLTFCRICAVLSTDEYCIYERVYKDGTLSMHMMLEKLVPPVFNAEQVKVDEFMRFPRKICRGCCGKVLEAYTLYEMSMSSGDLLRKRLSSKKNTTFIVNITGGSTETTDVRVTAPQTLDATPVRISRQSRETIIDVEHQKEQIVQKDTFSNEEPKDQLVDTCPNLLDKHLNLSEIEDQPSSSGEENDTASSSKVNDETYETKLPRKRVVATRQTKGNRKNVPQKKQRTCNASPQQVSAPKVKINQFPCVLCNESTFALPNELTEHWKAAHAEQIHCCKQCPKVFITKATYEHHQYCHATGRSHFCVFCDKGFQTEHLLKNHMRTHTHGTGFLCSQCGKEFSDRSNLRQHEYRHTGHKPWQCDLCPSRFSTKGYLTVHLLTHTKSKAYSCDTCGSQFNRHYSLVKHQVIHTGERHYECEVCKMKFASAHHVKIHMRTHTGEKPYKCGCCERSFAQKNDLLKHTKTHDPPFPCDQCDATFLTIPDLRVHLKIHDREGKSANECSTAEQ